jgi:hypothetical protein
MAKVGRPIEYTQEIGDAICEQIVMGCSIRTICIQEDMPAVSTLYRWLRLVPEFEKQYARAKEDQADALAEELLDIADDGRNDWMEARNAQGEVIGWKENGEALQRSRLRVDTRKWLASKFKAKKYGDVSQVKQIDDEGKALNPAKDMLTWIAELNKSNKLPSEE